MKVEKKSSNKIGLIILLIVVLVGLGSGGYFLYKHKDKLNIDWDFSLPWKKDEDNKTTGNDNNLKTKTQKTNTDVTFNTPNYISKKSFANLTSCKAKVLDFKDSNTELAVTIEITGPLYEPFCDIEIYQLTADGFTIPGTTNIKVERDEIKTADIVMKKSDLEAQEIAAINTLTLFMKVITKQDGEPSYIKEEISFTNSRPISNAKSGIKIDELNHTTIQYYKTTTDATNTYLYFIVYNESGVYSADIKVRKLLINDKIYDVKEFDELLEPESKRIVYISIPKKIFSSVKKFTISFINISTNNDKEIREDFKKSFYISNEYSKEL